MRTPLSSLDFQTLSPSLKKTLPYPPDRNLRNKPRSRPLIELPSNLYGSSDAKMGRWAYATQEEIRRARRHIRRVIKSSRPVRRLALKTEEGLSLPLEED